MMKYIPLFCDTNASINAVSKEGSSYLCFWFFLVVVFLFLFSFCEAYFVLNFRYHVFLSFKFRFAPFCFGFFVSVVRFRFILSFLLHTKRRGKQTDLRCCNFHAFRHRKILTNICPCFVL